jgi:hypothetical protein
VVENRVLDHHSLTPQIFAPSISEPGRGGQDIQSSGCFGQSLHMGGPRLIAYSVEKFILLKIKPY